MPGKWRLYWFARHVFKFSVQRIARRGQDAAHDRHGVMAVNGGF